MDRIMQDIFELYHKLIHENLFIKAVFSSPDNKDFPFHKITVTPYINGSNETVYQFSMYTRDKVKHENLTDSYRIITRLKLESETNFKQTDIQSSVGNIKILRNKKATKILKTNIGQNDKNINPFDPKTHNKEKNYIIKENFPVSWLIELGIMDSHGKVMSQYQKKFRQINKFLEFIEDIEHLLPDNAIIFDVGCGKSYLTFALYYYLNHIKNKQVTITGIDLKQEVVAKCTELAKRIGYSGLSFVCDDVITYKNPYEKLDMVISLHACDTATDYAIAAGILKNAKVILCVPCCQHEVFNQLGATDLQPLLRHGILKERFCAMLTDAVRAELLEDAGYKTDIIEFIDMEHTPKNLLIKAIKNTGKNKKSSAQLIEKFNINPTLSVLLKKSVLPKKL